MGVQRIEYTTLGTTDLQASVEFCTDVMGLVEIDRNDELVYLGCGFDANFDLALTEGETGIRRMGFRMTDDEFDALSDRLGTAGVETTDWVGPGHDRGTYFRLPNSGITTGIVSVKDSRYHHSADATHFLNSTGPVHPDRSPIAPVNLDHIGMISPYIEGDARFLASNLDFKVSDVKTSQDGEWQNAFIRYGNHHHDISLFDRDPQYTLHHLAWTMPDMNQMKLFADRMAQHDHQLELGFVRHGPGGNISIYFQEPGGNRFEFATELSTVDDDTPEGFYESGARSEGISLWGGIHPPETFEKGS